MSEIYPAFFDYEVVVCKVKETNFGMILIDDFIITMEQWQITARFQNIRQAEKELN